jgi:RsiW-degrading membrane proteinase PrsW (M82 family)
MTFPGSPQQAAPGETKWVFNPPPGWPAPPGDWQPVAGWQPDPSWPPAPPGWEFWKPAAASAPGAGELRLSLGGQSFVFRQGQLVRIGRALENDVVSDDLSVSRQHALLSWEAGQWVFENIGSAPTFLDGQPVPRVTVTQPLELTLGSPQGAVLRVEPVAAPSTPPAPSTPAPSTPPPAPHPHPSALAREEELANALHILFPVRSWLHNPGWRQGLPLLVIAYALLPLVFIAVFASSQDLATPGWAYALYIAPLWAIGFWMLIRPGPIRLLHVQISIGIVIWTLAWINIVTININQHLASPGQNISLPAAIGVGYNEEITKALPILLAGLILLKYRSVKLDVRMWMFLGTVAGLTFGIAEQAFYTSTDIVGIHEAQSNNEAVTGALAFAERIFVDGFQHAVWAGIAGFFIGMALNYGRRRVQLIILGVTVPAVLHALNDFLASSSVWLVILIQAASLLLFLGYTLSAASIEQRVKETPLFRGQSMMMEAIVDPDRPPPSRRKRPTAQPPQAPTPGSPASGG